LRILRPSRHARVTPVELLDWSETTSGWPRILSLARGRGEHRIWMWWAAWGSSRSAAG